MSQKLTKYEKARILGARSLQIALGAPILIKLTKKQIEDLAYNTLEIAELELEKGAIPMAVKRVSA